MANIVRAESLGEYYDTSRRDEISPTRRKWLHRKMKQAELYGKEMPYTINKKKKLGDRPRNYYIACDSCGHEMVVSKITYIVICSKCKNLCKIELAEDE